MFAIGRLNGNNLRFGSIDLTTSQMYTGILTLLFPDLFPLSLSFVACYGFLMELTIRSVHYFCASVFLRQSDFDGYFLIKGILTIVLWLVGASAVVVGGHASLLGVDRNPFEPVEGTV